MRLLTVRARVMARSPKRDMSPIALTPPAATRYGGPSGPLHICRNQPDLPAAELRRELARTSW